VSESFGISGGGRSAEELFRQMTGAAKPSGPPKATLCSMVILSR